jgi:hypothetical protein
MVSKKTALLAPTVDSLANQFSQLLRLTLTAAQMETVIAENRSETNPNVCHSGDFCDSNMVLHEVFMRYGMDVADEGGAEKWGHLWDAAWTLAKTRGFAMFKRGDIVVLLEEFQKLVDAPTEWIVNADEENGFVDLLPLNMEGATKTPFKVKFEWIRLRSSKLH